MEIDEIYLTLRAMQIIDFAAQWQDTAKAKTNILGVFLPKWKKKKEIFHFLGEKNIELNQKPTPQGLDSAQSKSDESSLICNASSAQVHTFHNIWMGTILPSFLSCVCNATLLVSNLSDCRKVEQEVKLHTDTRI